MTDAERLEHARHIASIYESTDPVLRGEGIDAALDTLRWLLQRAEAAGRCEALMWELAGRVEFEGGGDLRTNRMVVRRLREALAAPADGGADGADATLEVTP